jgi:hypothetical protein
MISYKLVINYSKQILSNLLHAIFITGKVRFKKNL